MVKKEIRIIGWDDCAHYFSQKKVLVIGTVFRGGRFLDGLLSTVVEKDGMDATDRISERMLTSRHYDQLSAIMLDGITFAGFNVVDINEMSKRTGLPVIAVARKKPGMKAFFDAMKKLGNREERAKTAEKAGRFYSYGNIFFQKSGADEKECGEILEVSCLHGNMPEPLRAAHIIASGLSGESKGRA